MGATMNGLPTGHAGLEIDEDHLRWVQSLAGVRLEILALLGAGPTPAGGLSNALDLDGTRVSKALAELRALGMVDVEKQHRLRIYRLRPCVTVERGATATTVRVRRENGNEASVTVRVKRR